jgi:co-chaperonin GroES (HSP10)
MKKLVDCKPIGASVLVEHISAQEAYGTTIKIPGSAKAEVPQGRVIAFGPLVEAEKYGFKVGDRVILNGTSVIVPSFGDDTSRGLVEPYVIKGVLIEEEA